MVGNGWRDVSLRECFFRADGDCGNMSTELRLMFLIASSRGVQLSLMCTHCIVSAFGTIVRYCENVTKSTSLMSIEWYLLVYVLVYAVVLQVECVMGNLLPKVTCHDLNVAEAIESNSEEECVCILTVCTFVPAP